MSSVLNTMRLEDALWQTACLKLRAKPLSSVIQKLEISNKTGIIITFYAHQENSKYFL